MPMSEEEWNTLIEKFEGDIKYPLKYGECSKQGHYFEVEPWRWFRYGWRWPWRSRMWLKCQGCGIAQLLPPNLRKIRSKRVPGGDR